MRQYQNNVKTILFLGALFRTHPQTEKRVAALHTIAESGTPAQPLVLAR